jgi:hypothetical protein
MTVAGPQNGFENNMFGMSNEDYLFLNMGNFNSVYFSYEGSPERKACLKKSVEEHRMCKNGVLIDAGITEVGILAASGTAAFFSFGVGGAVFFGIATVVNAGIGAYRTNNCDADRDTRNIDCPAGL